MNLVEVRHKLHMMPEIAFREFKTQAYIKELLTNLSISYEEVAGTGILARWESGDGPYILFRADMDALPVREETGC
ncbi:MAG TPA: amidohydrolase, partial [Mesotoga infera]|nr:amidohydrolase [Mesotoga infera]